MAWHNFTVDRKRSKYGAEKAFCDGIFFDSKREMNRYLELKMLEAAGEIKDLQMQVKYLLIPAQRESDVLGPKGGIRKGKLIEREVSYVADFVYVVCGTGKIVVEDAKGMRTKEYVIKRKLMLYVHGIRITEV